MISGCKKPGCVQVASEEGGREVLGGPADGVPARSGAFVPSQVGFNGPTTSVTSNIVYDNPCIDLVRGRSGASVQAWHSCH